MAAVNLKSLNKIQIKNIFDGIDTILSDCDGVLWIIDKFIKGVPETVKRLKNDGKQFFYITNNPMSTRLGFSNQMKALGYEAKPEEIICTSYLVASYLKSINFDKKVYIIGDVGIGEELDSAAISHTGLGPDVTTPDLKSVVLNFVPDPEIGAVAIGLDEHISYAKLMKAATYLNNPNVHFIATSMDVKIPIPNGNVPGPGALVKCVEACSGRKPIVLGKPEPFIRQAIIENFNVNPERTLIVGDNLHTDILLGKRCGIKTLLVLSGVTKEEDIEALRNSTAEEARELIPDFYANSLADIDSHL